LKACESAAGSARELVAMTVGHSALKLVALTVFGLGKAWGAHSVGSLVARWVDVRARMWVELSASHWAAPSAEM